MILMTAIDATTDGIFFGHDTLNYKCQLTFWKAADMSNKSWVCVLSCSAHCLSVQSVNCILISICDNVNAMESSCSSGVTVNFATSQLWMSKVLQTSGPGSIFKRSITSTIAPSGMCGRNVVGFGAMACFIKIKLHWTSFWPWCV